MNYLQKRLSERSTWAGISALGTVGTLFGIGELQALNTPQAAIIIGALAAVFAPTGGGDQPNQEQAPKQP